MTMTISTQRGIKRRCQNEACGLPFYDLNRTAFTCPNCGSPFEIIVQKLVPERERRPWRRVMPPSKTSSAVADEPKLQSDNENLDKGAETVFGEPEGPQEAEPILEPDEDGESDLILPTDLEEEN
jgi:hypothetical protein